MIFTTEINLVTAKIKKIFKNNIDAIICNAGGDIPGESITAFGNKSKKNDYMILQLNSIKYIKEILILRSIY